VDCEDYGCPHCGYCINVKGAVIEHSVGVCSFSTLTGYEITAQFMGCDNISLEEQLAKIKTFPPEPSLVVKTRNSLHTYWLIRDGKVENFRCVQRGLIAYFDADPQCVNESRVFRIPGFYHNKEEPIMVECVKFSPHLRYTQQELEAVLPIMPEEKPSDAFAKTEQNHGNQLGLKVVDLKCQFIKHCSKNAKILSEPHWYAICTLTGTKLIIKYRMPKNNGVCRLINTSMKSTQIRT